MLFFACSDRLLWHCCEAKPYSVDVLVATGLLFALVYTDSWSLQRQVLLYVCLSPVLLFLAYPACFLLGGMALTLLPAVVRARRARTWMSYCLFLTLMGVSFLLLLAGPIHAQRDERLLHCWFDMFPSWDRPWTVPGWLAVKCTELVRYTCEPTGNVLAPAAILGTIRLWRSGQRRLAAFCVWPVALAALAGLLGQYPFGATRVMVFAAPAALLLVAAGLPAVFARLGRFGWVGRAALAGVCLFPAGQALYRVACPWDRFDSARAAAFVHARYRPGDLVAGTSWEHGYYFRDRKALYRSLIPTPCDPPAPSATVPARKDARLWLVAAGNTDSERQGFLDEVQKEKHWFPLARYDFERTTVFCLAKKGQKEN
jgi:hypothetical protein